MAHKSVYKNKYNSLVLVLFLFVLSLLLFAVCDQFFAQLFRFTGNFMEELHGSSCYMLPEDFSAVCHDILQYFLRFLGGD